MYIHVCTCRCVCDSISFSYNISVSILYVRTYVCAFRRDGYKIDENTVLTTTYSDWDTISGTIPHIVTLLGTEAVLVIPYAYTPPYACMYVCMCIIVLCNGVRIVRSHLLVWLSNT